MESGKWWTLLLLSIFHFPLSIFNSYAYEVSSLSTSSSPVFVKTQDGAADLTYPVLSGNTFGSPDWYEQCEYMFAPSLWKLTCGGTVVSNMYGDGESDPYHTFWFYPTFSYPEKMHGSEWCATYDLLSGSPEAFGFLSGAYPPDVDPEADESGYLYLDSSPYDGSVVPIHDISGPGTIEFSVIYYITNGEQRTRSVTLFPASSPANIRYLADAYEYPIPSVEIWLPKFQRLTPASRSALIAAYEAYFERMYYGSKGVTDDGEDEDEWSRYGLGSPDAGPDFVLWSDKWGPTNVTDLLPDVFSITSSAYSGGATLARRHYPSSSFRLVPVDTNGINTLVAGVRGMCGSDGFYVHSSWTDLDPNPSREFCGASQFLVRPQWLLDGRGAYVPSECTYGGGDESRLWWSSRVSPPACQQEIGRTGTKFTPDFSSTFPKIDTTYYSYDADAGMGFKASTEFHDDLKAAQYLFTFADLEGSRYFPSGWSPSPIGSLLDLVYPVLDVLQQELLYVDRYVCEGLTFPGFVTNCVRQAARSLPLRSDAMAAYEGLFAATSSFFRVDSAPLAAVSHALGVMDRTVHVPAQNFVSTNVDIECFHSGSYAPTADKYEITLTLTPTNAYDDEVLFRPGVVISGFKDTVNFTATTNECRADFFEVDRHVNDVIYMHAYAPTDFELQPPDENLGGWIVTVTNEPYRGYEVGGYVSIFRDGSGPVDIEPGEYALSKPVEWDERAGGVMVGPILHLASETVNVHTLPGMIYDGVYGARIKIGTNTLSAVRSYLFSDFDANAGLGFALGPVMAGVSSSKPDQSCSIGNMCGGHLYCCPEYKASFGYDFFSAGSESCDSRSSAVSKANKVASDLAKTLSNLVKDKSKGGVPEDPRNPTRYAPLAGELKQKLEFDADDTLVLFDSYHLDDDIYTTETRDVGEETVVSNMLFVVEDRVSSEGTVWYSCPTTATSDVRYTVWQYGRFVGGEFVISSVTTNEDGRTTAYSGGPVSLVRDDVLVVRSTNVVSRRVKSGDPVNPYTKTVSSNVTSVTSFDGKRVEHATYEIYGYDLDRGGTVFERTETADTESPWPVDPYSTTASGTSLETVQLNPSDAKTVTVEKFKGLCTYNVMLTLSDAGSGRYEVTRIYFESLSPTNAPDIPDVSKWYVCGINASANSITRAMTGGAKFEDIEYDGLTNRSDYAEGNARPGVLMWTDWTWNALKRD